MNAIVQHQVSDMERMARAFVASKLFGVTSPDQALALCLIAQAEGRHPATAAQDYNIIQGRPAKKADAMLRDFLAGGGKVEWHTLTDAKADATFSHPAGGSARIDWDMKRAQAAQLGGKDMWKKFPRQMLRSRVISEGVRTVYPMATSGMYEPGEVADFAPDPKPQEVPPAAIAEMRDVTPRDEPKAAQQALEADGRPPPRYWKNGKSCTKEEAGGRMNSASAKERGEDEIIRKAINACDLAGIVEWEDPETFEARTSHIPFSWLDSVRDNIAAQKEALLREAEVAFRAENQDGVAGRISDVAGEDYLTRQFRASIEHEAAKAVA